MLEDKIHTHQLGDLHETRKRNITLQSTLALLTPRYYVAPSLRTEATSTVETTKKCMETTLNVKELWTLHVIPHRHFDCSYPVTRENLDLLNDNYSALLKCLLVCTLCWSILLISNQSKCFQKIKRNWTSEKSLVVHFTL